MTCRVFYNELILTVIIVLQFVFTLLLTYEIYLLLISLANELGFLEALFNDLFIIT